MLWLQRDHFDFAGLWENIVFELSATYDVVAAPGWHIEQQPQTWNEIWLLRSGCCDVQLGSHKARAQAGDVVLLTSGQHRVSTNPAAEPLSLLGFSFRTRLLGDIDFLSLLDAPPVLPARYLQHDESTLGLEVLLSRAVAESRARLADSMFAINGLLQLALTEVLRSMEKRDGVGKVSLQHAHENLQTRLSGEIVTALQIIAERYAQPLDIHTLARAVHLSPKHFARKFKAAVGMPPMEYLRRHRLQQAAQQLASDDNISHIAARCGFEDAAHFSRVFKAHFGTAPNTYRGHLRSFAGSQNSLSSPR